MATKKLARTIVEGGQRKGRSDDRRAWNRSDRRKAKHYYCASNLEWEDGHYEPQERRFLWKEYADKLKPLRRWVESHIGKRWDDAWSEFCSTNDARNLKGWHARDHVKGMVSGVGGREITIGGVSRWGYFVDDDGILRDAHTRPRRYRGLTGITAQQLRKKFGALIMLYVGSKLFWFEPVYVEVLYGYTARYYQIRTTGYRQLCEIDKEWYDYLATFSPDVIGALLRGCKATFDNIVNFR